MVKSMNIDVRIADNKNVTLLHWAAANDRYELVEYYLEQGAVIDAIGGVTSETALHWAVRHGRQAVISLLIKNGADPLITNKLGQTVLHLAAQLGEWPAASYLVAETGIDIDIFDTSGFTPLMYSAYYSKNADSTRALLALGADPDLKDRESQSTSFHLAMQKGMGCHYNTIIYIVLIIIDYNL